MSEKEEISGCEIEDDSLDFKLNSCMAVTYVIGNQVARTIGRYKGMYPVKEMDTVLALEDCDGEHFISTDTIVSISVIKDSVIENLSDEEKDPQKLLIYKICKCKS